MNEGRSKSLTVMAAGSLRTAFNGIVGEFEKKSGISVEVEYGPAGLLREKIELGAAYDVFASANMSHPRRLQELGLSGPVVCFIRNRLCIVSRSELGMNETNMLDILLDPKVKLGTSTPLADPSGDYALEFFERVERHYPGKGKLLSDKAVPLVGGRVQVEIPAGYSAAAWLIAQGFADAFISYTSSGKLSRDDGQLRVTSILEALGPIAEYGMTLHREENCDAALFRDHLRCAASQAELKCFGFYCL